MKSKYYFPHTATVFFSADSSCSLVLMDRKYLWAGKVQSLLSPEGIRWELRHAMGEFCPDTGIGHSNDAFF